MTTHSITIDVRIYDEEAFYRAALAHAIDEDNLSEDEANDLLRPSGEIDIASCLVMLFDPGVSPSGCQIEGSGVESF